MKNTFSKKGYTASLKSKAPRIFIFAGRTDVQKLQIAVKKSFKKMQRLIIFL